MPMRPVGSLLLALALSLSAGCAAPPSTEPATTPTVDVGSEATVTPEAVPTPLATPGPAAPGLATPTALPSATGNENAGEDERVGATVTPADGGEAGGPPPSSSPVPIARARVAGTGGQGANLREEPGTAGRVLRTLPEGTELTIAGADREVGGRTWRNVRDDAGTTGWVAAEVLAPIAEAAGRVPATTPPTPSPEEASEPCRPGQVKGDADSGLYYRPTHSDYAVIRERVRCFLNEAQARASGFQPAP